MDINLGLSASATGTVDVITATYSPAPTLVDKKILFLVASGANTSTTPTFSPNGLTAHTITKLGGSPLVAGDIAGANFVAILVYNLANTRWELLNPKVSFTPTLAQVLSEGASTGGITITSPDGKSTVEVIDGAISFTYRDGAINNNISIDPTQVTHSFSDGADSGSTTINATEHNTTHSQLIQLNAPSVTKNGDEVATVPYVDGLVVGLLDDRGSFDASVNLFPSSGGSGTAGAILKGDIWYISVAGTLGGVAVTVGDSVRALVDTPGQTATNWSILETNIGYVPENVANKEDSTIDTNTTKYPTVNLLNTGLLTKISHSLATAANDFLVASGVGVFVKKTLAETKTILGLAFGTTTGTYAEGNDARILNRVWTFAKDLSIGTATSGTSNTLSKSILIPANTIPVGTVIRIRSFSEKTGVVGTLTQRFYVNDTNDLTTPNLFGTQAGSTALFLGGARTLIVRSATETLSAPPTSNINDDEAAGGAVADPQIINIDWTIDQYIIIALQCSSALDSGFNNYLHVQIS